MRLRSRNEPSITQPWPVAAADPHPFQFCRADLPIHLDVIPGAVSRAFFSRPIAGADPVHGQNGAQWPQLYEITPERVSSVLAGMLEQFSDMRAYLANPGDLILVAMPKGKLPPMNDCVFQQPAPREELARIGVHSVADLNDSLSMDDAALRAFVPLYPSRAIPITSRR